MSFHGDAACSTSLPSIPGLGSFSSVTMDGCNELSGPMSTMLQGMGVPVLMEYHMQAHCQSCASLPMPPSAAPVPNTGSAGTGTSVSPSAEPMVITQVVTLSQLQSSDWTGDLRQVYEAAFGISMQIFDEAAGAMKP